MKIGFRVWILIAALVLALIIISPKLSSNVIVKSVDQDSLAFEQGIRPGMTINSINGYQINSLEDYSEAVEKIFASGENETRVSILTDQSTFIFFTKDISDISVGMSPHSKIKTGLDLSGGARAVIRPANTSFSEAEIQDLVAITTQRLNAFGLSDITVRPTRDLEGITLWS
jgi:membrane-associated protease RseP (regulator of RpoE activity)